MCVTKYAHLKSGEPMVVYKTWGLSKILKIQRNERFSLANHDLRETCFHDLLNLTDFHQTIKNKARSTLQYQNLFY